MLTRLSGLAALVFLAACGGDPGAPVPDPSTESSPSEPGRGAPTPSRTVALAVNVEGTGRIVSDPAGIDCPGQCTARFAPGASVTLTSSTAEGWRFDGWGRACAGGGSCAVVVDADVAVSGSFSLLDPRWDPGVGEADCASAWGNAGEKLSSCDTTKDTYVVVHKRMRNVALCKKGTLLKNLRAGLGSQPVGDKSKEGDGRTPEGVFYVPRLLPSSRYYKAFLISYPSLDAAARGERNGLITSSVRAQIESAHAACVAPPQNTALGGDIELHGSGSTADWTLGPIALDNAGIDLLWGAIGVGDTVVVLP